MNTYNMLQDLVKKDNNLIIIKSCKNEVKNVIQLKKVS